MTCNGRTVGTVIRWDDERHQGLIEAPDLPGECWVDATALDPGSPQGNLRAGQVVEIEWATPGFGGAPVRATRVVRRDDLQTGLGG